MRSRRIPPPTPERPRTFLAGCRRGSVKLSGPTGVSLRLRCPLRFARLLLIAALVLPLAVGAALLGPWSPLALARADRLAWRGEPEAAMRAYLGVSAWSPLSETRRVALYRAGVSAAQAGEDQRAFRILQTYVRQHPEGPESARALAQMGTLLGGPLENPARGARALERAAALEAEPERAADLLLEAVGLYEAAGLASRAFTTAQQVAALEGQSARGLTRMARLRLAAGDPGGAQELYERALTQPAATEADLRLARLGLSLALEDQGRLDQAAEVALTDADDPALRQRHERVQSRQQARNP